MPDSVHTLGALLSELRTTKGLSMAQVIEALGVARSTAYWWEGPESRPEPEDLQRLLDLYGAGPDRRLLAWELRAGVAHSSAPPELDADGRVSVPDEVAAAIGALADGESLSSPS